jgi:hypothetical protein
MLSLYKHDSKVPIQVPNLKQVFEDDHNKLIISTPGGLFGFYFMGVSSFIKENYELDDYVFSGASAGAWNSLFLSLKCDSQPFIDEILDIDIKNIKSIRTLEERMKNTLLTTYKDEDFDLNKLYLGVTIFDKCKFQLSIYKDFASLGDALDCCIASSHIPFITGGPFCIYRNKFSFDGGFSTYPYLNVPTPSLVIERNLWNKDNENDAVENNVSVINCSFETLFDLKKIDVSLRELYEMGYNDSMKNKEFLDSIFIKNIESSLL